MGATRKKKTTARRSSRRDPEDLSYIAESLRGLAVPIQSLRLDPLNARQHDEPNLKAIQGSLRTFGQLKPIVANAASREIEAGNGTYLAAQRLGWTHLAVVFVEHDPAAHRGFALADNRTAELARWDDTRLQTLLVELAEEIPDLYEDLLLDRLRAGEDPDPAAAAARDDESWGVLVKCASEGQQKILLERLGAEGYEVRAMIV